MLDHAVGEAGASPGLSGRALLSAKLVSLDRLHPEGGAPASSS